MRRRTLRQTMRPCSSAQPSDWIDSAASRTRASTAPLASGGTLTHTPSEAPAEYGGAFSKDKLSKRAMMRSMRQRAAASSGPVPSAPVHTHDRSPAATRAVRPGNPCVQRRRAQRRVRRPGDPACAAGKPVLRPSIGGGQVRRARRRCNPGTGGWRSSACRVRACRLQVCRARASRWRATWSMALCRAAAASTRGSRTARLSMPRR